MTVTSAGGLVLVAASLQQSNRKAAVSQPAFCLGVLLPPDSASFFNLKLSQRRLWYEVKSDHSLLQTAGAEEFVLLVKLKERTLCWCYWGIVLFNFTLRKTSFKNIILEKQCLWAGELILTESAGSGQKAEKLPLACVDIWKLLQVTGPVRGHQATLA